MGFDVCSPRGEAAHEAGEAGAEGPGGVEAIAVRWGPGRASPQALGLHNSPSCPQSTGHRAWVWGLGTVNSAASSALGPGGEAACPQEGGGGGRKSSSAGADRAKLLAGGCLQGGCSAAASINLWGTSASATQA